MAWEFRWCLENNSGNAPPGLVRDCGPWMKSEQTHQLAGAVGAKDAQHAQKKRKKMCIKHRKQQKLQKIAEIAALYRGLAWIKGLATEGETHG